MSRGRRQRRHFTTSISRDKGYTESTFGREKKQQIRPCKIKTGFIKSETGVIQTVGQYLATGPTDASFQVSLIQYTDGELFNRL